MIPRFSIKHMLCAMIALGMFSFLLANAWRGSHVSQGLSVAIAGAFIPFLAYAALHWLSFAVALIPIPGLRPKVVQNAIPLSTSEIENEMGHDHITKDIQSNDLVDGETHE